MINKNVGQGALRLKSDHRVSFLKPYELCCNVKIKNIKQEVEKANTFCISKF